MANKRRRYPLPKLRAIREKKGVQREVLAVAAGITVAHIYNLEAGLNRPGLDIARRLASALGVQVDDVFPSEAK